MTDTRWLFPKGRDVREKASSETLGISEFSGDQGRPELVASLAAASEVLFGESTDLLGEPLSIREVADLIGCSPWTVRHRYLTDGLPHFRTGPTGKLIFYKNQVIRWLLDQQKGGA
jgi:hypothetical protein